MRLKSYSDEIISLGFEYDGQTFGITNDDITKITGLGILDTWPNAAPDMQGQPYIINDMATYKLFYAAGMDELKAILQGQADEIARAQGMTLEKLQTWGDSRIVTN